MMLSKIRKIRKKIKYGRFTDYRGSGTENDPFLVSNSTELYNLTDELRDRRDELKLHVKLVDNIVFECSDKSFIYVHYLCIDGNGFSIKNADFHTRINKGCYIRNIKLIDCNFVDENRGQIYGLTFSSCGDGPNSFFLRKNDGHIKNVTVNNCNVHCIIQENYGIIEDMSIYDSSCNFFCLQNKAGRIETISSEDTIYDRGIVGSSQYGDLMYSIFTSTKLDTPIEYHVTVFVFEQNAKYSFKDDAIQLEDIGVEQLQDISEQQVRYLNQRNRIDINEQQLKNASQKELTTLSNDMIATLTKTNYISEETQLISLI